MKIILTVECLNDEEHQEALTFVASLTRQVERKKWQGLPGMVMERGDVQVWVSGVEVTD